jgi:hypothetical protein
MLACVIDRLLAQRYGISDETVLNGEPGRPTRARPPDVDLLAGLMRRLKVEAAATNADGLDYGSLAKGEAYQDYRRFTADLRAFDPSELGDRGRQLAFWVNLYNGLVVDAVVQWRIRRSVLEQPGFFWRAAYNLGGLRYSANDIESGILRANAPHPAIPGPTFHRSDPRRRLSLPRLDPRVHFALVCASRSCPPVAAYDAGRIDEQLDLAARAFIRGGGADFDAVRGLARLSRIFQWYAVDFGGRPLAAADKRPLLRFIAAYLPPAEADLILARRRWTVRFARYDWSLNGWPLDLAGALPTAVPRNP